MEKLHPKRHLYLYAKGHYPKSEDRMQDLKIIFGNYTGIGTEMMDEGNVLGLIISEIAKLYLI